ncbi:hypothetical protein [Amycolatopsis sp. cmx-4-54]
MTFRQPRPTTSQVNTLSVNLVAGTPIEHVAHSADVARRDILSAKGGI